MKLRRREFMGLVGTSLVSVSVPAFSFSESSGEGTGGIERNGWRLQVTPAGEIVSFTDGKLELINRRWGDNRPVVVVGGMRQYPCERPSLSRQDGSRAGVPVRFLGPG